MMKTSRRAFFAGMAAGTLPLFNIGCAAFGQRRKVQLAAGAKTDSDAANAHFGLKYRKGWETA